VKELALAFGGPGTTIAPGTELGSQLFTRGRLLASGGAVAGGSVISGLIDGAVVGVAVGVAVAVGAGKLCVVGTGEGEWLVAMGPAQPAATSRTRMPAEAALAARRRPRGLLTFRIPSPYLIDEPAAPTLLEDSVESAEHAASS
jgi:hypothetical protein